MTSSKFSHLLMFLLITRTASGQQAVLIQAPIPVKAAVPYTVETNNYSAVLIEAMPGQSTGIRFIQDKDTINLMASAYDVDRLHLPENFVFLNKSNSEFTLISTIDFHLKLTFYDGFGRVEIPRTVHKQGKFCDEPEAVDQNIWRSGLPDPSVLPAQTTVNHCIIHHSAGSNSISDYTAAVRSIYLLHTQTNGWDDIGYNYVIAPDGTIFNARDPQGVGDQDNIQGAHFCSKNSGTLGICLLGNYTDTGISSEMYESLMHLLTWKLNKENLNTLDSFPHPDGQSEELGVIAFHRDGCSTICPGDSVVQLLSQIQFDVQLLLDECSAVSIGNYTQLSGVHFWPNPGRGELHWSGNIQVQEVWIYDHLGKAVSFEQTPTGIRSELENGFYHIILKDAFGHLHRYMFIIVN